MGQVMMTIYNRHVLPAFLTILLLVLPFNVHAQVNARDSSDFETSLDLTWIDGENATRMSGVLDGLKPTLFLQSSWTFQTYGSVTVGDRAGDVYLAHTGIGYFLWDDISINFEGVGGYVDSSVSSPDGDGSTLGFDVLARWHYRHSGPLSLYVEGGIGMIWFEESFPRSGTHQNFTPQVGLGATLRLSNDIHLMGGVRWHHISNATKTGSDRNPGFDGAMIYGGLMIPF